MAQRTDRIPENDAAPYKDGKNRKRKNGSKGTRFFKGYLMIAGGLATVYMLARGFVWLCTLIAAWQG